jgi:hypothetical protein
MYKSNNNLYLLMLCISFFISACTVSVSDGGDPESSTELYKMESLGFVYSQLEFSGSDLNENCNDVQVKLSNGSTDYDLEILTCESNSIIAWIPEDVEPDKYDVTIDFGNLSISSIDGEQLETDIKIRPVILSMSTTEIIAGETLDITGLHIINNSSSSVYDPKVWLMKSGYTNTVSEITVNTEGTAASIIIDEDTPPGVYDFLLSTEEWSNQLELTIK